MLPYFCSFRYVSSSFSSIVDSTSSCINLIHPCYISPSLSYLLYLFFSIFTAFINSFDRLVSFLAVLLLFFIASSILFDFVLDKCACTTQKLQIILVFCLLSNNVYNVHIIYPKFNIIYTSFLTTHPQIPFSH